MKVKETGFAHTRTTNLGSSARTILNTPRGYFERDFCLCPRWNPL